MNIIEQTNKEFSQDIKFLRGGCLVQCDRVKNSSSSKVKCSCERYDEGVKRLLNDAIRRVLENFTPPIDEMRFNNGFNQNNVIAFISPEKFDRSKKQLLNELDKQDNK
jgi:hypothetical protein